MTDFSLHHEGSQLELRLTPWDRKALGMVTAEITRLHALQAEALPVLLDAAQQWCRQHDVAYLFGRIDANDHLHRAGLLDHGFAFVEVSMTVSRNGFAELPAVPRGMLPALRPATVDDIPMLRQIAEQDFVHGRFLEDPAIPQPLARRRTANWIEDMVHAGLVQTAEARGTVIGFHAERVDAANHHANLLLTGASSKYAMLALPLWVTALQSLQQRGVQRCTTLISAANTGVINLYARLGFQFNSSLTGFRKFL